MNLVSATSLRLRVLAILLGMLPGICMAGDYLYRVGPVDNTFLRNPAPATSVNYGSAMTSGDFNDDFVTDLVVAAFGSNELQVLFGVEWEVGVATGECREGHARRHAQSSKLSTRAHRHEFLMYLCLRSIQTGKSDAVFVANVRTMLVAGCCIGLAAVIRAEPFP
jgi:hypothetical protein